MQRLIFREVAEDWFHNQKEIWSHKHILNVRISLDELYVSSGDQRINKITQQLKERIKKKIYKTQEMTRTDVFDDIEMFYNQIRHHSHLNEMSPEAFKPASK